jgi:DnaK suppressor protein
MADTSFAVLRGQLEEERARLRAQIRELGYGDDSLDFDENFADSGQVTAERGEADAVAGQLVDTLAEIDEALAKLDAGTYGMCESCHEQISEARLEAMPAARLCISCASKRR